MQTMNTKLGVIGGSGIYQMSGVSIRGEHRIDTPFGSPSDAVMELDFDGKSIFFIPRHGRGHRFTPTEVNYRANIFALKSLGVTHLLAVSAVGIMREDINPGDLIVPDQLFDRTKGRRADSFFGDGVVGHVPFADPFSEEFRNLLLECSPVSKAKVHAGGTLVVIEGPAFSTRAESNYYRQTLNPVAIGMTALPEAKLAREAELAYAMIALATDYDCWHKGHDDVTVDAVIKVLKENAEKASLVVREVAKKLPPSSSDPVFTAAETAIMTQRDLINDATKQRLRVLYGKYL